MRKYTVGTWSCCTNLHLTCCLIKPLSLCDLHVPAIKGGYIVKCLKYANVALCFCIFIGNHSGVVLSINSREMHSYLVSWYLQLNTKPERLFSVSFYFSLVMSQNCKYGCKCWWRGDSLLVLWKKASIISYWRRRMIRLVFTLWPGNERVTIETPTVVAYL